MTMLRNPIAMAATAIALLHASTSFAQGTQQSTTTTTTAPTQSQQHHQQPGARPPVGTTTTTAAPYAMPGGERIAERTTERRPNRPLLGTGTGLFILSYAPSAVVGAMSERPEDRQMLIPVVGPWMDLEQRRCGGENRCGANEDINKAMIVTSGVVQGVGVLMALGALIIPETTTVEERVRLAQKPAVKVVPVSFGAGAGLGAIGRF